MSQEKLKKLRTEYNSLMELLALDLTNWDPRTKTGVEGRQNAAKIRIEEVKRDLNYHILKNSKAILVMRDYEDTDKVVAEAKKNAETTVILDLLQLEKGMFKQLFTNPKAQTYTFNSDIVNRMNILMFDVGQKIEATSMPVISASATGFGTVKSRQAVIEKMESALNEAYGTELKTLFSKTLLRDETARRLKQNSINVVVVNVTPGFVGALSGLAGEAVVLENGMDVPKFSKKRNTKKEEAAATEEKAVDIES